MKKNQRIFILGSLGLIAVTAILTAWFSNTEIGKSPLFISIVVVVGLLPNVFFLSIPDLKNLIKHKKQSKSS